jgi:hypothetical protein
MGPTRFEDLVVIFCDLTFIYEGVLWGSTVGYVHYLHFSTMIHFRYKYCCMFTF